MRTVYNISLVVQGKRPSSNGRADIGGAAFSFCYPRAAQHATLHIDARVRGTPRHLITLGLLAFFQAVIVRVLPRFVLSHASNAVYVYASLVIVISRPHLELTG
jgi:hypothetical protein